MGCTSIQRLQLLRWLERARLTQRHNSYHRLTSATHAMAPHIYASASHFFAHFSTGYPTLLRIVLHDIASCLLQRFELLESIDNLIPFLGRDKYTCRLVATHQDNWRSLGHLENLVLLALQLANGYCLRYWIGRRGFLSHRLRTLIAILLCQTRFGKMEHALVAPKHRSRFEHWRLFIHVFPAQ